MIELFSVPREAIVDVAEIFVTEALSCALTSVSDGDLVPVGTLIENAQVNEYVREAGLHALTIVVVQDLPLTDRGAPTAVCVERSGGGAICRAQLGV